ncbi:MAG: endonuclease III [Fibromonadaceae bacterium]|jgi:endonuclease-3|nr:endonuclease III [Fibromonadaceae bacterium]
MRSKLAFIKSTLDKLYPNPPIPLAYTDAFSFLIAVVLSAQCKDSVVNTVTPSLMSKAPTPQKMAELSEQQIYSLIKLCGLAKNKSKFLKELSKIIVKKHSGKVPDSFEELEALPGVGHKTASVVMSHIFGVPAFPIDTHIHRLAHRWGLSDGSSVLQTEKDLKAAFPKNEWVKRHLQFIYYGRKFCPARGHDLKKCVICRALGQSSATLKS